MKDVALYISHNFLTQWMKKPTEASSSLLLPFARVYSSPRLNWVHWKPARNSLSSTKMELSMSWAKSISPALHCPRASPVHSLLCKSWLYFGILYFYWHSYSDWILQVWRFRKMTTFSVNCSGASQKVFLTKEQPLPFRELFLWSFWNANVVNCIRFWLTDLWNAVSKHHYHTLVLAPWIIARV